MSIITIDIRPSRLVARTLSLRTWIVQSFSTNSLEQAQVRACHRFAKLHPIWAESLFDAHFLRHAAAPLIGRCLRPGGHPIAEEFVLAWWSQFSNRTISLRELSTMLPVAAHFLQILDAELGRLSTPVAGNSDIAPMHNELPANPSDQLLAALHESSNIEMDWLWVAKRLSNPLEQRYCYQRALYINPDSEEAQKSLARL